MSSPVCLSTVPILRCLGISREESALLLIPAGLEVVFSVGIIVAGRGQGKRRFILALEGPVYMLLATLDVLTHMVPIFQSTLLSFKIMDIAIGAASFIPILLFTTFLYLFKRAEFFISFPRRFTFVANVFALIAIPVLLITNGIGSFIGNSYAIIQFQTVPPSPPQFAVGTSNQSAETARLFFSSLALALMAAFSFVTFLVFFVRLSSSFVNQRRIEDKGESQEETYLFKGTGWLAVGLTFAAAESFAGFASGSFGLFFTRRLLRMLSRACVAIGVVKGPDRRLQFDMLDSEKHNSKRKSTMRLRIGAPLLVDSSRRISQLMGIDLTKRRDSARSNTSLPLPPTMSPADSSRRVTVSLRRGRAPTLILRLSDTNLPSPSVVLGRNPPSIRSSTYSSKDDNAGKELGIEEVGRTRSDSRASIYSTGKSLVENFGTQAYPGPGTRGLPSNPRVRNDNEPLPVPGPAATRESRVTFLTRPPRPSAITTQRVDTDLQRRTSKRKVPPPVRASMYLDQANFVSPISPPDAIMFPSIPDSARRRARSAMPSRESDPVQDARDPRVLHGSSDTTTTAEWAPAVPRPQQQRSIAISVVSARMVDPARAHSISRHRTTEHTQSASLVGSPEDQRALDREEDMLSFDWLTSPDVQYEGGSAAADEQVRRTAHARNSSQVLRSMHLPSAAATPTAAQGAVSRSVSFGTVSSRQTPEPSPAAVTRASVNIEQMEVFDADEATSMGASSTHNSYRAIPEESAGGDAVTSPANPRHNAGGVVLNHVQLMERYGEAF